MELINIERVRNYSYIFVGLYIALGFYMIVSAPGLIDIKGNPKGGDFITFYSASVIASMGDPANCYSRMIFEVEKNISGSTIYSTTWDYPPSFLLVVLPLATMPYLTALMVWTGITITAYLLIAQRFAPSLLTYWVLAAFPGTFQNLIQGQNGFLTTALLGGGLLLLDKSPFVAGLVFGLLSFKPQLAWLTIIALVAGRRWTAAFGAALSSVILLAAGIFVFGEATWAAFLKNLPIHATMLGAGVFPLDKMPTLFAGCRLLGIPENLALILQAPVTVAAVATVVWVWYQNPSLRLRTSALAFGTCLASPYLFDYDLAVLSIAIAALAWEGCIKGWLKHEKAVLLFCWLIPFLGTIIANITYIQLSPVIIALSMALIIRRVRLEKLMLIQTARLLR